MLPNIYHTSDKLSILNASEQLVRWRPPGEEPSSGLSVTQPVILDAADAAAAAGRSLDTAPGPAGALHALLDRAYIGAPGKMGHIVHIARHAV